MDDADREFSLMEPFDIDGVELDGIDAKNAFVLGVEWQMVSDSLKNGEAFSRPIHAHNAERIKRQCIRQKRLFRVAETAVPGWMTLDVAGDDGKFSGDDDGRD